MKTLILLLALLCPQIAWGAAAHDASNHAVTSGGGSVTTVTISSFTIGANSNRYLICGTAAWDGSGGGNTASVTWNNSGVFTMTKLASKLGGFGIYSDVWGLVAPTTGTGSITATISSGGFFTYGIACTSAYNIDQSASTGTIAVSEVNDSTSANPTLSVTSSSGDLVVDFVHYNQDTLPTLTVGGGQTERTNAVIDSGFQILSSTEAASGSSTSMDWSASGGSGGGEWISYGVALKQASSNVVRHRPVFQ